MSEAIVVTSGKGGVGADYNDSYCTGLAKLGKRLSL